MRRGRLPAFALLASLALCLVQAAYYYRRLPYLAVSHFNAQGLPDGYMDRAFLVGIYVGTELLIAAAFLLSGLALSRLPVERLNLPNREHWLAPERREESLAWMSGAMMWMGTATLILLFDIFGQMLSVNLGAAAELSHPELSLVAYLVFSTAWTAAFWSRFGRTPG